jgi:hypothetical protein
MSSVYLHPERKDLAAMALFHHPRFNPETTPEVIRGLRGEMFQSPPPTPNQEEWASVREFVESILGPMRRLPQPEVVKDEELLDCVPAA